VLVCLFVSFCLKMTPEPSPSPPPPPSNNTSISNTTTTNGPEEVPICCEFVKHLGLFRVLRAKGKALASGGFGVTIANASASAMPGVAEDSVEQEEDSSPSSNTSNMAPEKEKEEVAVPTKQKPATTTTTTTTIAPSKPSDFLFIEEVVFLFERGLLECLAPTANLSTTETTTATTTATVLDSSQLYQLLLPLGVSFPIYFTYAHLRSQDFRVLRHAPERLALLQQQQQQHQQQHQQQDTDAFTSHQLMKSLRHQVRESIQRAAPPTIQKDAPPTIAWDVYSPNSDFAKTRPGIPDFYVTISYYNVPSLPFHQLQTLLYTKSHGIPLKIATVSDSGTVVMFGLDNFGAPPILK
jgi:hypothetical protein